MTRVLVVRGHQATPWELAPWGRLPGRFDVRWLRTPSNRYATDPPGMTAVDVRTRRDRLPKGLPGDAAAMLAGDRYVGAEAGQAFAEADVVHAEELGYWFSGEAARRARPEATVVMTAWETLPMLDAHRTAIARRHRPDVLRRTDLWLAATERARLALLLEGVAEDRVVVAPPGIDVDRFAPSPDEDAAAPDEHVIVSAGRLVHEKGHHDVLRAVALLARDGLRPRVRLVGAGPEEGRLRAHADELGIGPQVAIGTAAYDEMPAVFAQASCLALMSLPAATGGLHPFDVPRTFWEEQFGMVFAEAMAAGLDVVTTDSGAIAEVLDGQGTLLAPGDWPGLARALREGPLSRPPGQRVAYPDALVQRYSLDAAAQRLAAAYDRAAGV